MDQLTRDTAVINIPLSKRGNIDAEIDRYKARKAKDERDAYRARAAQHKIDQAKAKEMVDQIADERAAALCSSLKLTRKQLITRLARVAHWTPALILRGI